MVVVSFAPTRLGLTCAVVTLAIDLPLIDESVMVCQACILYSSEDRMCQLGTDIFIALRNR